MAALNRLEADLPSFVAIEDPDRVCHVLKILLRHAHAQLSNAALNFCHSFLPLLRSNSQGSSHLQSHTARVAITSLTPAVLERAGDGRERTRDSAARALEELGKIAIDNTAAALSASTGLGASHKGKEQETPLVVFERYAREGGLMSKSAKIREQVRVMSGEDGRLRCGLH